VQRLDFIELLSQPLIMNWLRILICTALLANSAAASAAWIGTMDACQHGEISSESSGHQHHQDPGSAAKTETDSSGCCVDQCQCKADCQCLKLAPPAMLIADPHILHTLPLDPGETWSGQIPEISPRRIDRPPATIAS
jgi:hypothetical protein